MDEKKKLSAKIAVDLEGLSFEMQEAVRWLVKNIDIVDRLTKGSTLTQEEAETMARQAMDQHDYILFVLIQYRLGMNRYEAVTA